MAPQPQKTDQAAAEQQQAVGDGSGDYPGHKVVIVLVTKASTSGIFKGHDIPFGAKIEDQAAPTGFPESVVMGYVVLLLSKAKS